MNAMSVLGRIIYSEFDFPILLVWTLNSTSCEEQVHIVDVLDLFEIFTQTSRLQWVWSFVLILHDCEDMWSGHTNYSNSKMKMDI